ncbi:MAG: hypothetical protein ACSHW0_19330 [Thalassotalea sp.]
MELLSIIIVLYLYLNCSAIYYAVISDMFSKHQLIAQSILVFLVPFLGAILVLYFSISQIGGNDLKQIQNKPKVRLLSYVFLTFLITNNSSDTLSNGSSPSDFGGSDGGGD